MSDLPSPLDFFARLVWIDGTPLLDTIEPYRRRLFMQALHTFRDDGTPLYNLVLSGRAKKNFKSCDLILAAFYKLLIPVTVQGNDCLLIANDEDQAGDDLDLAKKLVRRNPDLAAELDVRAKEIGRRDDSGAMKILPARDAIGAHGKTAIFVAFDEIHGFRNWDVIEGLQPDPTRTDALTWMTSYDTVFSSPGVPLFDLKQIGRGGEDERMLFQWYSGDLCTDPDFADLPPEERANPSMGSWPEGKAYLEQQRRRLPSNKFRRLHLNLPGSVSGAFFDSGAVFDSIVTGRRALPPMSGISYSGFVDMSGGSNDDACLGIAHKQGNIIIVDLIEKQAGGTPFNPRDAVRKFAGILKQYRISKVVGDAYAGETFREDFRSEGIAYEVSRLNKTDLYEHMEPALNAGEVDLPNVPKLQEQMLGLVYRGARVDHMPNEHDDFINAAAGCVWLASGADRRGEIFVGSIQGGAGDGAITLREPERTRIRIARYDEQGRPLTPAEVHAIRRGERRTP